MSIRTIALRVAVAAALLTPAVPAQAAPPSDVVSVRLSLVTFTGIAKISKGRPGRPASIRGYSTSCNVLGVLLPSGVPFTTVCEFDFATGLAPLSTACTGAWKHNSVLTFTIPVIFQPVIINYDPTVTDILEGDGTGHGVNATRASKVNYVIDSLCALSGESDDVDGNLRGWVSGPA